MSGFKDPSYLDRKSAATDAKKAALEKFRARASADGPAPDVKTAPAAKTQSPNASESKPAKRKGK